MPQGKSVVDASSGGRLNSRTARPGFAGTVPGWTPNATAWKTRSEDGWRNDAGWSGRGRTGGCRRLGFGRRLLFVLVTGTCVFASIMLFAVMAGRVAGASRESSRMFADGRNRSGALADGFGDAHGVRPSVSKLVVQAAAAGTILKLA